MMLRVLIADDHTIVRQGVRQLLMADGVVSAVGEAETGAQAIELVRQSHWDVVLLDISLPDTNGLEVLKQLRRDHPCLPVMLFSMYDEGQFALRALKAGAAGYLSKRASATQLVHAVRQVASGRKYVSPQVAESLADYLAPDADRPAHEILSDREYQTLCMIGSGKRLTDIANALSLSVKTVSVYRSRLLEKMRLSNNAELTFYVMQHGLADPEMAGMAAFA
ncbi:DNA-binding response regulator [Pandoraea thiooxydans]|uniref:LuxR family transcriptional regulator n=1 Tax=Pandoraea thiooxydans TaxID=445709 RepID=A0A0G3EY93_9BURK|nr:response regulator transcription factor [Pandoraea thiooxydans]AKJ69736.1 DNA-binding response regulator [Pandoraea thiooxydans]